jgi:Uma2 family endonuclease
MSPEARERVVASLPSSVPLALHPPEGDPHRLPKERAREALDQFFRSIGRRVYLSSELATYYPRESMFCPDILAVLDVEPGARPSWIVSREGKGLDLVIEIHVDGDPKKDFTENVTRYARLGISEYFIFDRRHGRLHGHHLPEGARVYERVVPQFGRFPSRVLGVDLSVEGEMLRFYYGTAPLPFMDEVVSQLRHMVAELIEARDAATRRTEEEAGRADALAEEVAALRAEVERLKRG